MYPTGRRWALLPAAVIAMLLAACTGTSVTPGPGRSSIQPNGPATSSATPPSGSALACGNYIDANASAASLQVVLGVVALPTSPRYPALQTSLSGEGDKALRLFAKTGLVIKPGTTFELIVPAPFNHRLSIGWGLPGMPSHRVAVNSCPSPGGKWLAYAGGYWIDHPACVPIIVKAGGKQQTVHIGIGTPCPGQQPPQGPSQS
jgi:hypothetical protein